MSDTLDVVVLAGGPSAEAEVSRSSAAAVVAALDGASGLSARFLELDAAAPTFLINQRPDVVFPVLHGPPGEDGTVQGLLEMLGLPYVGGDPQASAFAMHKGVAKSLFAERGLPMARDRRYRAEQGAAAIAVDVQTHLGDRVAIKPMQQGSALGVTPLPEGGDLEAAVTAALELGSELLVEEFVVGREMTVGVLDPHGERPSAFPVIEIETDAGQWYDFHNRYAAGASRHLVPAAIPDELTQQLQTVAIAAHDVLGLRDLSRADFIVRDDGTCVLLEVNSLPGMTPTSLYPDGAAAADISFPDLLTRLIRSAQRRAFN
ncbi:MAG: D-alanine--D-alanine ligase [Pseudomonadota bacterium]